MVTIYKETFGDMNGRKINKYKMIDDSGFQVNVINYGAIITDIITKDRNNKFVNIVLGYNTLESYKHRHFGRKSGVLVFTAGE